MILYFSGTGNSAYLAKRVGNAIGDEAVSYTHLLAAGTDQRKWRAGTPERHGLLKKKKFAERDQESILSADFLQLYYVPQICKEIIFFPWGDFPSILSRFFSSLVKAERLFCRSSTLPRLTSGPQHIGRWMCAPRTARESSPGILAALFLSLIHIWYLFIFLRVTDSNKARHPSVLGHAQLF